MARYPAEPSLPTVKTLFGLSNNVCSFRDPESNHPACEQKLVDPLWKQVNAVVCHIRAASPGGPRYDPTMTDEERANFDNLLLLCPNHHRLVDNLEPERYSVELLHKMKSDSMISADWASDALLDRAARALIITIEREYAAGRLLDLDMSEVGGEASIGATGTYMAGSGLGATYLGAAPIGGGATGSVRLETSVTRTSGTNEETDDLPSAQQLAPAHKTSDFSESAGQIETGIDDLDGSRRAAKIQATLKGKGYPDVDINGWWNTPTEELQGSTPTFVWLRHQEGDRDQVEAFADAMPRFSM